MRIAVVCGTDNKGCTWNIKNLFLKALGEGHEVTEWTLPRDLPVFCMGCAACFTDGVRYCANKNYIGPIWKSIEEADLLVFASPVYAYHTTGAMKNLLDHLSVHCFPHRPKAYMMNKQAVILTDCPDTGNKNAADDILHSLDSWGTGIVYKKGFTLTDSINWKEISDKKKDEIKAKLDTLARKVLKKEGRVKPALKIKKRFRSARAALKSANKKNPKDTMDYRYWKDNGWLDGKKPWKQYKKETKNPRPEKA